MKKARRWIGLALILLGAVMVLGAMGYDDMMMQAGTPVPIMDTLRKVITWGMVTLTGVAIRM